MLRNLGRADVTGAFTEKNLSDAIKHNKFLKSYWSDYAIKQGGAVGWTAMEEHEKIKSFLQDLRDKVKPSQFLSLAEKEFDSIDLGHSGLAVSDFIDRFVHLALGVLRARSLWLS